MKTIKISSDFSEAPIGRYRSDGPFSGEVFREDHLLPALKEHDKVIVNIDDTEGYGSSFLEEAFGGIVRHGHFSQEDLKQKLEIVSYDKTFSRLYLRLISEYIQSAKPKS